MCLTVYFTQTFCLIVLVPCFASLLPNCGLLLVCVSVCESECVPVTPSVSDAFISHNYLSQTILSRVAECVCVFECACGSTFMHLVSHQAHRQTEKRTYLYFTAFIGN